MKIQCATHLALPANHALIDPPQNGSRQTKFWSAMAIYAMAGSTLTEQSEVKIIPGQFPANTWADYEAASDDILRLLEPQVVLQRAATTQR